MAQGTKNKNKNKNKTGGIDPSTHSVKFRVDFRSSGVAILPGQCVSAWNLRDPWFAKDGDDRLVTHMALAVYKEGALCIDPRFPLGIWGGVSDAELSTKLDPVTAMAEMKYPSGVGTWRRGYRPGLPSLSAQKPLTVGLWQRAEGYQTATPWDPKDCPFWAVEDQDGTEYFDPTIGAIRKLRALPVPYVTTWESVHREGCDFFPHYTKRLQDALSSNKEMFFVRPGTVDTTVLGPGEASYEPVYEYPAFSHLDWPELSCDFFGDRFHRWLQSGELDPDYDPNPAPRHVGSFSSAGGSWF